MTNGDVSRHRPGRRVKPAKLTLDDLLAEKKQRELQQLEVSQQLVV